ncbi:hypothetical protein V1477_007080 [Vespula maculifrons]|uniref:Uncharacterized protein n=1 Tax=Vespula maculifrons TaxID=7453 RepID=A0ABD2CHH9_VESMC
MPNFSVFAIVCFENFINHSNKVMSIISIHYILDYVWLYFLRHNRYNIKFCCNIDKNYSEKEIQECLHSKTLNECLINTYLSHIHENKLNYIIVQENSANNDFKEDLISCIGNICHIFDTDRTYGKDLYKLL